MPDIKKDIVDYSPTRRVCAYVGAIIITGAELDHVVSLALFTLIKVDFSVGFALFDRATINTKLTKLRFFLEFQNEELTKNLDALNEHLEPLIKIRNNVAHGTIIGKLKSNNAIAFLITSDYTDDLGGFVSGGWLVSEEELYRASVNFKWCLEEFKKLFDVKPLHEIAPYTLLREKPTSLRSQRKNDRSSKPRSRPRPSQK